MVAIQRRENLRLEGLQLPPRPGQGLTTWPRVAEPPLHLAHVAAGGCDRGHLAGVEVADESVPATGAVIGEERDNAV
jgi:hypothetical protein